MMDAPKIDKSEDNEIVKFNDKDIKCRPSINQQFPERKMV